MCDASCASKKAGAICWRAQRTAREENQCMCKGQRRERVCQVAAHRQAFAGLHSLEEVPRSSQLHGQSQVSGREKDLPELDNVGVSEARVVV